MVRNSLVGLLLVTVASPVFAAPLFPSIISDDFGFLASYGATYDFNGSSPDRLLVSLGGREVYYYTATIVPPNVAPVFDVAMDPNYGPNFAFFGGDLYLNLVFTASDAPFTGPGGTIDVSLTGMGGNNDGKGYDLEIWGQFLGGPYQPVSGLLLAMEITSASLYGYGGGSGYQVEAIGTIKESVIPWLTLDQPGAVTGTLLGITLPSQYTPQQQGMGAPAGIVYSGHAGVVIPEPVTYLTTLVGALGVWSFRRRHGRR